MPQENVVENSFAAARSAMQKANWRKARKHWSAALVEASGSAAPQIYSGLSRAELQLKSYKNAEAAALEGLQRFPHNPGLQDALARVALEQRDWLKAEEIWNGLIAKRPGENGAWYLGLFETLIFQDRIEEAKAVLAAGREKFPQNPFILNKLTLQATDDQDWEAVRELAAAGRQLCQENGKKGMHGTFCLHLARALFHCGAREEACDLVLGTSEGFIPTNEKFRREFIDVLCEARELDILAQSCESGFLSSGHTPHDANVVFTFIQSNRTPDAAKAFASSFKARAAVPNYNTLVRHASLIFRGEEKARWYRRIEDSAADLLDEATTPGKNSRNRMLLQTARLNVLYGLEDRKGFARVAQEFQAEFPQEGRRHIEMAERLKTPDDPKYHQGKIFGIGLSKTGTTSLTRALDIMGFSAAHYFNNYSGELLAQRDIALYDALTDTPISYQFEQLYERYPDAKFIYTTRPLEKWVPSLLKHIQRVLNISSYSGFDEVVNGDNDTRHGELFRDVHNKLYVQYKTPEEAYHAHDANVRNFFAERPEANFLEINFFEGDGFPELARFLGCPEPDQPFPWENVAAKKTPLAVRKDG